MKLISLNIEVGLHNEKVLEFLKKEKADVVCLQELLDEDFELYKKELEMEGFRQIWHYQNKVRTTYLELIGKKDSIAIFAKNIVDHGSTFFIGKEENLFKKYDEYIANEEFQNNGAFLWVDIKNADGKIFKFITTHLPVTKDGEVTPFQLEVIDALLKELGKIEGFVLCGDTNAPRGKESFGRLAEKYKDNIPNEYKTSIDQNLHRVKGLQYMVDGLFTTPNYIASNVKLIDGVSDHMAIVAEIDKN